MAAAVVRLVAGDYHEQSFVRNGIGPYSLTFAYRF
jgi:hypothetical protein